MVRYYADAIFKQNNVDCFGFLAEMFKVRKLILKQQPKNVIN